MITLITPTADRPAAFALCERWVQSQTIQWDQWLVVDDGHEPVKCTLGQEHIKRKRNGEGNLSLIGNILEAIPRVRGDRIVIVEDDDYYKPHHLADCIARLEHGPAAGSTWLYYYNIAVMGWRIIKNPGAALACTALRDDSLPLLEKAANRAKEENSYHIDGNFWRMVGHQYLHDAVTVIGMKGLPGRKGLGVGHKRDGWTDDIGTQRLRQWLGEDAAAYLP